MTRSSVRPPEKRPLGDQVVVITGASSGIGREAALRFAREGARLVLAARGKQALETLASEIRRGGGRAVAVPTDVSDMDAVDRLAEQAITSFGRIDTWVNNAGVSLYACFEESPLVEMRRVMEVNYWGTVHGLKAAIPRMTASGGGTIICVGSALSDAGVPLQGAYVASKHAIAGLTASVRQELMHAGLPISLSLIKPSSVDTPLFRHARTRLGVEPQGIPPVYDPAVMARAIVHCATRPERELLVGGAGELFSLAERVAPRLLDWQQSRMGIEAQRTDRPKGPEAPCNLFEPMEEDGEVRLHGRAWRVSWVTWMRQHPRTAMAATALALISVAGSRRRR